MEAKLATTRFLSEDTIDSFILEVHSASQSNPLWFLDDYEGFSSFHEFIHQRFDKYWSQYIRERNYN